eukprot:TRINITY_DN517_c0_g1_i4.p1 TRINITY_DN517_c0_g1~~TRINITY_DN517_c0_g1_i4.p1  ORF type:complete len:194 (-),score=41.30 TRINITY_DN517_c0_g1_i4:280-861(-)
MEPRRYMVALDFSLNSDYAFHEVLKLINKETDNLYILAVNEVKIPLDVGLVAVPYPSFEDYEPALIAQLAKYADLAKAAGVKNYQTILVNGFHAGEAICSTAEDKKVNYLVIGRRGLSKIKRIVFGSTSSYCLEHAPCSTITIKMPPELESQSLGLSSSTTPINKKDLSEKHPSLLDRFEHFRLHHSGAEKLP